MHPVIARRLSEERVTSGAVFRHGGPRVAMLYPSPYRVGMSSLGFQWVLSLLRAAGISAERAFLPDDLQAWGRRPLITYETGSSLSRFPLIAVSLAYEPEIAGLIRALDLAGIPPLRRDRDPALHPRILLGGPLTFSNPLPVAPFVDAMLVGEADDTVVEVVSAAFEPAPDAFADAVLRAPGGYLPQHHGDRLPPIAKASQTTLPATGPILAPEAELRDMFLVEGERGCHRGCAFCVMRRSTNGGMRLVGAEDVLARIPEQAQRVGLVGAAISDHPGLVDLLGALVEGGREVGVSSLRADQVARKPDIARLLALSGYRTLTVASDAASKRLRRTIQKGTTEDHLRASAQQVADLGLRQLKVYMMVGLPDENDDDIDELVRFTTELSRTCPVSLGIAPFVPKKNTPMADLPFAGQRVVEQHLKRLGRGLRGKAQVRPTSARWAWVEAVLAQGDARAGEAVLRAVKAGGRFSDWRRELKPLQPEGWGR